MNREEYLAAQTERRESRRPSPAIKARSKKRVKSDAILATIKMNKIAEDAICKIRMPGVCTGFATTLNHIQKTSPKNRLDENNLEQSCWACNQAIENKVEWAKANGHQRSRFAK